LPGLALLIVIVPVLPVAARLFLAGRLSAQEKLPQSEAVLNDYGAGKLGAPPYGNVLRKELALRDPTP
jgi:hypothetical protein